jgi:hypothetical protein
MSHLSRLRRAARLLTLEALALTMLLRLSLWCLPYATVQRLCAARFPAGKPSLPTPEGDMAQKIAAAVTVVGRCVPGLTTCLVEALAVTVMLRRRGFEPVVRFGIRARKPGRPALEAHAWVECGGSVVVGQLAEMSEYRTFTSRS